MCGRFNLRTPAEIQQRFGFLDWQERLIEPRFNIAPSQEILTVVLDANGVPVPQMAKWGLEPFWLARNANGRPKRPPPINARAESLLSSRMFREAFRGTRCLIPATGFYEWQVTTRAPMHIQRCDGSLFAFAGLWLPGDHGALPTVTIVTTAPNELMSTIHNRMPA